MSESVVVESRKRKISGIWIVPLVAVLLGLWLAVDAFRKQGPTITLYFSSAEGLQADKTQVKVRSVTVGTVTSVRLADDLERVVVTAELTPQARQLLRDDSQFWVVRAEGRGASVSGIGTLLSGAYIEISPAWTGVRSRRWAHPANDSDSSVQAVAQSASAVRFSIGATELAQWKASSCKWKTNRSSTRSSSMPPTMCSFRAIPDSGTPVAFPPSCLPKASR